MSLSYKPCDRRVLIKLIGEAKLVFDIIRKDNGLFYIVQWKEISHFSKKGT